MADNVQDATFEILKGIHANLVEMNRRFERLETSSRRDRRNISGLMTLLQATSGDFDERIRDLDERVETLQDRTG